MNVVISDETYRFACRRCQGQWEQVYSVRRWVDCDGDEHVACALGGAPAAPPWSSVACPRCGGYRTAVLPFRGTGEVA